MKVNLHDVPRQYSPMDGITIHDMGDVTLNPDEQLTFRTESGKCNDVARKEWGFYLSNSLNWNLRKQGFKTALVASHASTPPRLYLNLVEVERMEAFQRYLTTYNAKVVCWLDDWLEAKG